MQPSRVSPRCFGLFSKGSPGASSAFALASALTLAGVEARAKVEEAAPFCRARAEVLSDYAAGACLFLRGGPPTT
jgi:hypothetical protein